MDSCVHKVRLGESQRNGQLLGSLVVLETAVLVSRPKFCGLSLGTSLGLEALVSAVFETYQ